MPKRPISVTIIGLLFIVMGVVSQYDTLSHLNRYISSGIPAREWIFGFLIMELTRVLAIVVGVLLLRRSNLGRWLAVAWLAFHVILSFQHNILEVAMHAVFLVLLAFLLFRRPANVFFRGY